MQKLPKPIRDNVQLLLIGAVLVLLLVGTFVAVQLSQIEQENRQKASVSNGQVAITARQSPSPFVANGSSGQIILSANTNGVNVDGIQLTFNIFGDANIQPVTFVSVEAVPNSGVIIFGTPNITTNNDGSTTVSFAATGPSISTPFSSNTPVDFARVKFTVVDSALIKLAFDTTSSLSNITNTVPPEDTLNLDSLTTIGSQTFNAILAESGTPTNTLTPAPTICAMPTAPLCQANEHINCVNQTGTAICQQCSCVANTTSTATPTLTPTNTPLATSTPYDAGVGGVTAKYCGESCTNHSDCAVNLLCYSGVCRLANNPTDTSCNNPPDNGIHRVCNDYCADNRECQTGLTCYYNRCRNPRNATDQYCAAPVAVANNTTVVTKTNTVIVTSTPLPTELPKGGDNTAFSQVFVDPNPLPTHTPSPTFQPIPEVTPEPQSDEFTMIQTIQSWLKGLLLVAVAISVVFFLLWLLPLFLRKKHDDDDLPPTPMTGTGGTTTSPYSDGLREKTSGGNG
ncbi:MAG: hypothetical protein ABI425_03730 [Patescibacteria group bacterium]